MHETIYPGSEPAAYTPQSDAPQSDAPQDAEQPQEPTTPADEA